MESLRGGIANFKPLQSKDFSAVVKLLEEKFKSTV